MSDGYTDIIKLIKSLYPDEDPVPLHAPRFIGKEKQYLNECIDSTFVSYVGQFVNRFEQQIREYTGSKYAVAMVNGTAALELALIASGVKPGEEVITQALTFVATVNAIVHSNAVPIFIDVDKDTLGLSPDKLEVFLNSSAEIKNNVCYNKFTGRKISACVPMHTFGHPVKIDEILTVCSKYNIKVVEDSAESLGSYYKCKHTGTFGVAGIFSFNGNKPVTTGGGGMLITDDSEIAERARYISTTAKKKHQWEFYHDQVGFNLRMPNINAAVGCAQTEKIDFIIENKRELAEIYKAFFNNKDIKFISEPENCSSNYWLNTLMLKNRTERDNFLRVTNKNGIQTRPVWVLMNRLPMYSGCQYGNLDNAEFFEKRLVNIPSSVRI